MKIVKWTIWFMVLWYMFFPFDYSIAHTIFWTVIFCGLNRKKHGMGVKAI